MKDFDLDYIGFFFYYILAAKIVPIYVKKILSSVRISVKVSVSISAKLLPQNSRLSEIQENVLVYLFHLSDDSKMHL